MNVTVQTDNNKQRPFGLRLSKRKTTADGLMSVNGCLTGGCFFVTGSSLDDGVKVAGP